MSARKQEPCSDIFMVGIFPGLKSQIQNMQHKPILLKRQTKFFLNVNNTMPAGNISSWGSGLTKIENIGPKQESANYRPQTKYGPQPVFINKFYWKAVRLTCLQMVSGCAHTMQAQLRSFDGDRMACQAENIYSLAFDRKSLLISGLKEKMF